MAGEASDILTSPGVPQPGRLEFSAFGDELDRKYVGETSGTYLHIWERGETLFGSSGHSATSARLVRVLTCVVV